MKHHQNLVKSTLYQINQQLISYVTCEMDNLTETIDTVKNLNNRTTAIEKEVISGDICR